MRDPTCLSRASRPTLERSTPPPARKRRHQRYREATQCSPILTFRRIGPSKGSVFYTDLSGEQIVPGGGLRSGCGLAEGMFRTARYGGKTRLSYVGASNAASADTMAAARGTCRPDGALGQHGAGQDRVR